MIKYFKTIILILFALTSVAQTKLATQSEKAKKLFLNAYQCYQDNDDEKAMELVLLALQEDNKFIDAYLLAAELYNQKKDYVNEIWAYKSVIKCDVQVVPKVYLLMADAEMLAEKYEEAKAHYMLFLTQAKLNPKNEETINIKIKRCEFAIKTIKNPVPLKLYNLGANVNSKYSEYWPGMTADEQMLIYTIQLPGDQINMYGKRIDQEDFYVSYNSKGFWLPRVSMGEPMNTTNNEGAQSISADGQILVFTGCNRPDGLGNCDLYLSTKNGNTWSVPQNMGRPINSISKETQPSLSADGRILYFASDRKGTKGGLDIWKSYRQEDESWSVPINLGDTINTKFDDQAPFLHPDNHTLYFSSYGHIGMGGCDLYFTRLLKNGTWDIPQNMGYPLNTPNDEVSIHVNAKGTYGLISSERPDGFGKLDIYRFDLFPQVKPKPVTYMKGVVFNANTKELLEAKFELIDLYTSQRITSSKSNAENGEFLVCLPIHNRFALNISKPGFLFYSDYFMLENVRDSDKVFLKDIPLQPIEVGKKMILKNIFFDVDKFLLREESNSELNKLVAFLTINTQLMVEIGGHTDKVGSESYNLNLSNNRAKSVYEYLILQKISPNRLTYKGYGSAFPLGSNSTEDGKSLNRRTEIKIIK